MSIVRLKVIRETIDGFPLAEEDLKLRGEGDVLGIRQSDLRGYRVARPEIHGQLIMCERDGPIPLIGAGWLRHCERSDLSAVAL